MAGTSYSLIYDLMVEQIKDYNLTALYQSSESDFNAYMQGFLVLAIADFTDICTQDLEDRNDTTGEFTATLTTTNQVILSQLMVKHWLKKEVQDVLQMNLHITDRDFKLYSEAQNLKSKQDYLVGVQEELDRRLSQYAYKNNDWANWYLADFDGID